MFGSRRERPSSKRRRDNRHFVSLRVGERGFLTPIGSPANTPVKDVQTYDFCVHRCQAAFLPATQSQRLFCTTSLTQSPLPPDLSRSVWQTHSPLPESDYCTVQRVSSVCTVLLLRSFTANGSLGIAKLYVNP